MGGVFTQPCMRTFVSSVTATLCPSLFEVRYSGSEGSPRSGAMLAPQPCIRLGPCGTRTMKQLFASAVRLRGGGPILDTASKSHGCVRVTTTSDHDQRLSPRRKGR